MLNTIKGVVFLAFAIYQQILNNTNLSRETSLNSRKSMEGALSNSGYTLNPRTGKWEK